MMDLYQSLNIPLILLTLPTKKLGYFGCRGYFQRSDLAVVSDILWEERIPEIR